MTFCAADINHFFFCFECRYDGFIDFFYGDVQVKGAQPDSAVVVFDSSDPVTEVLNGQRLINLGNNKVVYAKPFTSLADL